MVDLLRELKRQEEKLLTCVHCGFCLPACPTYIRLGDEADSPRGRLHFMRAAVDGRVEPGSPVFHRHLDRCLGCRACESVCPSGVEYGKLLEGAREVTARARAPGVLTRIVPRVMGSRRALPPVMWITRILRGTGLPRLLVARLPGRGLLGQARLGLAMIASTAPPRGPGLAAKKTAPAIAVRGGLGGGARTGVLQGCVQAGLLARVNRATERVLAANGYEIQPVHGQGCCGALHAHTGDLEGARALARNNIVAFEEAGVEFMAVNAAGCGAAMKEYPHLLSDDAEFRSRASSLAARVRDVSELLGRGGIAVGAALDVKVTYDAPCHLLHAQRISEEPLTLLQSVPGVRLIPLKGSDECCGGAGVYGITHPDLGGRIGGDKVEAVLATGAEVVATPNPGCMMQIGAGLLSAGSDVRVVHPIELVDESYRAGGLYGE